MISRLVRIDDELVVSSHDIIAIQSVRDGKFRTRIWVRGMTPKYMRSVCTIDEIMKKLRQDGLGEIRL